MKIIFSFICILFCNGALASDEWYGPFEYKKFEKGFAAGTTQKGLPIYLGMALHTDRAIDLFELIPKKSKTYAKEPKVIPENSQWIVGKVRKEYDGLRFGLGIEEKYSKNFMMFLPKDESDYIWVKASDGEVPKNSVRIWGEEKKHICRAGWAGAIIPGTLDSRRQTCAIAFGGRFYRMYVYEVLVKK